ncbi:MAG TPA: hypothetical protein VIS76_03440 [Pseudomonadales bacterium]
MPNHTRQQRVRKPGSFPNIRDSFTTGMIMTADIRAYVDGRWDASIVPTLCDYIRIPNKSPMFDPDWAANGHMQRAV